MPTTTSGPVPGPVSPWKSLSELGRQQGLSAVQFGRLLSQAGLREANGQPSAGAIAEQLAYGRHKEQPVRHAEQPGHQTFWHQERCLRRLERQGLLGHPQAAQVEQWTELLSALLEGSASISTSAEQMAEDLPRELVGAVNSQLKAKGCSFQVKA